MQKHDSARHARKVADALAVDLAASQSMPPSSTPPLSATSSTPQVNNSWTGAPPLMPRSSAPLFAAASSMGQPKSIWTDAQASVPPSSMPPSSATTSLPQVKITWTDAPPSMPASSVPPSSATASTPQVQNTWTEARSSVPPSMPTSSATTSTPEVKSTSAEARSSMLPSSMSTSSSSSTAQAKSTSEALSSTPPSSMPPSSTISSTAQVKSTLAEAPPSMPSSSTPPSSATSSTKQMTNTWASFSLPPLPPYPRLPEVLLSLPKQLPEQKNASAETEVEAYEKEELQNSETLSTDASPVQPRAREAAEKAPPPPPLPESVEPEDDLVPRPRVSPASPSRNKRKSRDEPTTVQMTNFPASWVFLPSEQLEKKVETLLQRCGGELEQSPVVLELAGGQIAVKATFKDGRAAHRAVDALHGLDSRTEAEKKFKGHSPPEESEKFHVSLLSSDRKKRPAGPDEEAADKQQQQQLPHVDHSQTPQPAPTADGRSYRLAGDAGSRAERDVPTRTPSPSPSDPRTSRDRAGQVSSKVAATAASTFAEGEKVLYWSKGSWHTSQVLGVNLDPTGAVSSYDLDIKHGAKVHKIRKISGRTSSGQRKLSLSTKGVAERVSAMAKKSSAERPSAISGGSLSKASKVSLTGLRAKWAKKSKLKTTDVKKLPLFEIGQEVSYFSKSISRFVQTSVVACTESGGGFIYDLACKKGVAEFRIRKRGVRRVSRGGGEGEKERGATNEGR